MPLIFFIRPIAKPVVECLHIESQKKHVKKRPQYCGRKVIRMTTNEFAIVNLVWGLTALFWTVIAVIFFFKKSKKTTVGFLIGGALVSFFMIQYMDQIFTTDVSPLLHWANAVTFGIFLSFIPMDTMLMAHAIVKDK